MPIEHALRALAATALVVGSALPSAAAEPKPIRALLVCGGCCHDYTTQKALIARGLADRAHIEVTVVQQGGTATTSKIPLYENPDWSKGFDVVIHDECFSDAKDRAWTERIIKPHREGLPAVVIHCAMHCYRDGSDEWFKFCGVTSRQHGAAYPHEVVNRDPAHPVMKNFGPAWLNPAGELYWIEQVWPKAHPLASSKNKENGRDEVCVWTNEYGQGLVFGTTLGHHNETVSSPAFLDLLTRGTLWACEKLEPRYLKEAKPHLVPANLARGRPTLASSEQADQGNKAANAVDGKPGTRWCAAGSDAGQWWQVDLGAPTKLNRLRLDWEASDAVYRYKVEGSNDGKTWRLLADGSANTKAGPNDHTLAGSQPRFVRVTFLGSNTGVWGSLREVELFGDRMERIELAIAARSSDARFLGQVTVPEGFEATLFAAPPAVSYPVAIAAAPSGDLFVSVDKNGSLDRQPNRGAVVRLRDVDGDGRADQVRYFVPNVDSPRGLVWDHDRLYLMHPPHLSAFIDLDGDGVADEEKVLVKNIAFTFKDRPADHTSNGVTLGIDGWLYLAIGDFGFLEATGADGRKLQLRGGGVVRVRPDGTGLELYSRGTRNILEVALDPLMNGFTRDNTNDGGGWDIRLHHFSGMEDHGYPSLFQNFKDECVAPLADYGGGSGCGSLFLSEPGFPSSDRDVLYTADWGRERVFRHRLTPRGATFAADQTDFLGLPRVTDLDVDAMSRIYASSWKGATFTYAGEDVGFIVRLAPKGYRPEPLPDFEALDGPGLVRLLESPSHRRRLEAQRTLLRRGLDSAATDLLRKLASDSTKPLATRVAAIFALKQGLKERSTPAIAALAADASIREYALRALTDRTEQLSGVSAAAYVAGLENGDPRVRRQAAVSLARLGRVEHASALTKKLDDPDPLVAHTVVKALVALKAADACFAVVDRVDVSGRTRTCALRVLQALHDPAVVEGLVRRLDAESDAARRNGLLAALCRLHFREGAWKGASWGTRPDTSGPYYQPDPWEATPRVAAALKRVLDRARGAELAGLLREMDRHKIPLGANLDVILAAAACDSTLVPVAVGQLARSDRVPSSALPLLIRAAEAAESSGAVRAQAVTALAKTDSEQAVQAILNGLAALDPPQRFSIDYRRARDAFLHAPGLGNHIGLFESTATKREGWSGAWADAALLVLSTRDRGAPESRARAVKTLEEGWSSPARRAQILRAVMLAEYRPYSAKVLTARSDPDPAVASAARDAARALRLDRPANPALARGPRIGSLTTDAVLTSIVSERGDARYGEQLFTRLSCVNCHTVRADEPPKGPFLGNIARTYKRRELAEAILLPSKTIAQGFATNLFALEDGTTVSGFVVREAADKVTIRTGEGKEVDVVTAKIEERSRPTLSVMPEGLVKELTLKEFASLLDYLESLSKAGTASVPSRVIRRVALQADVPRKEPVDPVWMRERLEKIRLRHKLPALSAAAVIDGRVVSASAVGFRKLGSYLRVSRDDAFPIGSITRVLTATLAGKLVDEGRIGWDTTLREMFPELEATMKPAYRSVTLAQLLAHTGGFPYQPSKPNDAIIASARESVGRRYAYVQAALADDPEAPPGTKTIYSGGAILFAAWAERQLKVPYESMMKTMLFDPLSMKSAGFGMAASPGRVDAPWWHRIVKGESAPISADRPMPSDGREPAGGAHCSMIDLGKFLAVHLEGARGKSDYLRPETFKRLDTPVPPGPFAPGWQIRHVSWAYGPVLSHTGTLAGGHAEANVVPEDRYALCVATNAGGDDRAKGACAEVLKFLITRVHRGDAGKKSLAHSFKNGPIPPRPEEPLDTLEPVEATVGLGTFQPGKTIVGTPLLLDGEYFRHGVGVHAPSKLVYALKPEYARFVARVGVEETPGWRGSVLVKVYVGDKLIHESPLLRAGDEPWNINVELPKRPADAPGQIRLEVTDGGDDINCDWADWVDAGFLLERTRK